LGEVTRTGALSPAGGAFTSLRVIGVAGAGTVAFRGAVTSGPDGLFSWDGSALGRIAVVGDASPAGGAFTSVGLGTLTDAGVGGRVRRRGGRSARRGGVGGRADRGRQARPAARGRAGRRRERPRARHAPRRRPGARSRARRTRRSLRGARRRERPGPRLPLRGRERPRERGHGRLPRPAGGPLR